MPPFLRRLWILWACLAGLLPRFQIVRADGRNTFAVGDLVRNMHSQSRGSVKLVHDDSNLTIKMKDGRLRSNVKSDHWERDSSDDAASASKAKKPQSVSTSTTTASPGQASKKSARQAKHDELSVDKSKKSVLSKVKAAIKKMRPNEEFMLDTLSCSGCLLSARSLRYSLSHHVKRKYKGDPHRARMAREASVQRGITGACDRKRYPDQMAATNPHRDNLKLFEYKPKDEADALGVWPASSDVAEEVVHICKVLVGELRQKITERTTARASEQPWNLEWERWICQENVGACDAKWFQRQHKGEDKDEDDEL